MGSPTTPPQPERVPLNLSPTLERLIEQAERAGGEQSLYATELRIIRNTLNDWRSLAVGLAEALDELADAYEAMQKACPEDGTEDEAEVLRFLDATQRLTKAGEASKAALSKARAQGLVP